MLFDEFAQLKPCENARLRRAIEEVHMPFVYHGVSARDAYELRHSAGGPGSVDAIATVTPAQTEDIKNRLDVLIWRA